ncbi:hypothetical protein ASD50_17290 [Mesorhizobium sp. Root552]|uniref:hypothetical protein n=1 Tax=Mesorhizobium sp. Root552 TaxID=1736555 RepID=UPI0006F83CCF|nr:hypothetical protein [Mesorhizobium sp. Root552]KQZ30769.1 hypothetical protein ASD50_17290 [Mesorhizobium sp. Root552]
MMWISKRPTYVIVAPQYCDSSGGNIFLHRLANELACIGERAVLWPMGSKPRSLALDALHRMARRKSGYKMMPDTAARLAHSDDLHRNAIVVYPEVVMGNPLGAKRVVRWLMYPPKLRGTAASFGPNDLFFKVSDFSDDVGLTGGAALLQLFSVHPAYTDYGNKDRNGTCYMVRKQADKPILHDPDRDVCLDGLDHETIADQFNRCERFICYDEATIYAQFAALCGCLPIVVPGFYQDRAAWAAHRPIAKNGVAFGLDDTDHAIKTRHLLAEDLRKIELEGRVTVRNFVERTKRAFGYD